MSGDVVRMKNAHDAAREGDVPTLLALIARAGGRVNEVDKLRRCGVAVWQGVPHALLITAAVRHCTWPRGRTTWRQFGLCCRLGVCHVAS